MRTNSVSIEQENSMYHSIKTYISIWKYVILKKELKEAFALFDRVGGGVIRTKDLEDVMHSIGYQTTPAELDQMIREADQDGLFKI
jgi:hypothetical protein